MPTSIVVMLFVLGWITYLGWWAISRRTQQNYGASIKTFSRRLTVIGDATSSGTHATIEPPRLVSDADLQPTPARPALAGPQTLSQAQLRRVEVIATLAGGAAMALFLGIFFFRWVLLLHVVLDLVLIAYLGLLARSQQLAAERAEKVRHLPTASTLGFPELELFVDEEAFAEDNQVAVGGGAPVPTSGSGFRVLGPRDR